MKLFSSPTFAFFVIAFGLVDLLPSNALARKHKDTTVNIYQNTIKLASNSLFVKDRHLFVNSPSLTEQIGLYFDRRVYKFLYASAGYMQWKRWHSLGPNGPGITEPLYMDKENVGKIMSRNNYRMVDVLIGARLPTYKTRHTVFLSSGFSYAWGYDTYLTKYYEFQQAGPLDYVVELEERKASYKGLLTQVSYDYWFYNNRFNIGLDFRGRFYNWRPTPPQYDLGLHVGVSF